MRSGGLGGNGCGMKAEYPAGCRMYRPARPSCGGSDAIWRSTGSPYYRFLPMTHYKGRAERTEVPSLRDKQRKAGVA
jgi:hypothetical protein